MQSIHFLKIFYQEYIYIYVNIQDYYLLHVYASLLYIHLLMIVNLDSIIKFYNFLSPHLSSNLIELTQTRCKPQNFALAELSTNESAQTRTYFQLISLRREVQLSPS